MNTTQRPSGPTQPGTPPENVFANPYATYTSPSGPRAAYAYPQPTTPWWERDGVVAKILAGAGVLVTLVGVVMLLVIAAKAGLLRPELRVAGGALLSGGLIAGAIALSRRPGGRIGAVALAATGAGGLFLCDVAATIGYAWIAAPVGMTLAGFIGAAVVALAMRWNSQPLAALMMGCVGTLAPVLTGGHVTAPLIGFLTLLLVVGCVPEFTKEWPVIAVVRTLPATVAALWFLAEHPADYVAQINAFTIGTVALCSALAAATRGTEGITAVMYLLGSTPVLIAISQQRPYVAAIAGAAVAVITLVSIVVARPVGPATAAMGAVVSGLALLLGAITVTDGDWLSVILLSVAIAFAAALYSVRNHAYLGLSIGFGVIGVGRLLATRGFFDRAEADTMTAAVAVAALLATIWVVVGTYVLVRRYPVDAELLTVFVPPALMGTSYLGWTAATVAAQGVEGYDTAHLLVTVTWLVLGLGLLALSLRVTEAMGTTVVGGLIIVAVSIGKLFLVDLAALSGIVRAGGFLVVGLLLLGAGAAYAPQLTKRLAARRAA